ncbi:MAG: DUF1858 domain-containing protein [Lachnospiraceae bacterium]|nr:DUF1858 domain-containing protein [Lachnospiraceae bacterium]
MNIKEILFGNETEEEQAAAQTAVKEKEADTDEVTTDMLIVDIISQHPIAAQFLMDVGMECLFCPASQMETLEQACMVHGIDAEEIAAALNEKLQSYKE